MFVWKEPQDRHTSLVGIVVVSGVRMLSVAHLDAYQSLLIGLYLKVTRGRHVHLYSLPCLFGRNRKTDIPHWLVYLWSVVLDCLVLIIVIILMLVIMPMLMLCYFNANDKDNSNVNDNTYVNGNTNENINDNVVLC
jgi:hypothetical protein